jgi:uncharacterized protein YecE (DUF72 family)
VAVVRVGISGWAYPAWRGRFYPAGLGAPRRLGYVAERLSTVEINASFYSLQRPERYQQWYAQTPEGFCFAVKGSRFITHLKRLRDVGTRLANFFASGVLALEDKLGPILWQLPPTLAFDAELLAAFFDQLPRSMGDAAALARTHDERLTGRAWTETITGRRDPRRPIRHAVEVRHASFAGPECVALLREHRIALVAADSAGRWPALAELTTDFGYVRLHGERELYASGYDDAALDSWAALVRGWAARGADCYVYFDNDARGHAPFDAMALAARLR